MSPKLPSALCLIENGLKCVSLPAKVVGGPCQAKLNQELSYLPSYFFSAAHVGG